MEEAMNFHTSNVNHHCLVCGTDSLANYVDMTLVTSRTSQSETLVREKLKTILRDKWIPPDTEMSMVICLPCFHLVDQFDALENQLQNIRDNLAAKYVGTNGIKKQKSPESQPQPPASGNSDSSDDDRSPSPVVITTTTRGRKAGTIKITKRPSTYNRKEKTSKRKKTSAEDRKSAKEAKKAAAETKKAATLAKRAAAEAKKAALEAKREKARVGVC